MTLPSANSAISFGDVNVELSLSRASQLSLGADAVRILFAAGEPWAYGAIRLAADGWGKSSFLRTNDVAFAFGATSPTTTMPAYKWSDTQGFGTKYTDTTSAPGYGAGSKNLLSVEFNPSSNVLAAAAGFSPYLWAFQWTAGSGFGSKYSDPGGTMTWGKAVSWHPSGTYVVSADGSGGYVNLYPWSNGFGSQNPQPGTLPTGAVNGTAWAPSGNQIAFAHNNSPYVSAYPWVPGFGSKYANPATLPGSNTTSVAFSSAGTYIGVTSASTPYVTVYPWSPGFGTKITNPASLPTGTTQSIAWSKNSDAVMTIGSGGISGYPWSGGFGTKYTGMTSPPTSGNKVFFTTGAVFFVGGTNFVDAYAWSAGFGTKFSAPSPSFNGTAAYGGSATAS